METSPRSIDIIDKKQAPYNFLVLSIKFSIKIKQSMSKNPPTPEIIYDILVCDKDYKFLRKIDDHFTNMKMINIHVTSVYKIDALLQDLGSSPFQFIIIGPSEFLEQDIDVILKDQIHTQSLIKVIGNESPENLIEYLNKGIKNMVSMDSLLQNFELVLDNIIHFGSFVDPCVITSINSHLPIINQFSSYNSVLQPKAQAVFELLKKGYSYTEIAKQLNTSLDSVRYYIKIIYRKFNVKSKVNAINKVNSLKDVVHSF